MHQAMDQLMAARATLQTGAPDKGGHRVRAIALVDRAIAEVRMGIGTIAITDRIGGGTMEPPPPSR